MSKQVVDYIIVGQGLAGSCLALQLIQQKKKFIVIDQPASNSATQVAAGLFNPVTGKIMGKTWLANSLFPYLHQFYQRAEEITGSRFYYTMPVYRPFHTIEEQNEWMGKSADPEFEFFIDRILMQPIDTDQVKNPYGGLLLKHCGYLNTQVFCQSVRNYLAKLNARQEENLDETKLTFKDNRVYYKNAEASSIVYCTGEKIRQSQFFSWLPIKPLKGETLHIACSTKLNVIYNRGVYLVPEIWKVGATYSKQDQSEGITTEGRKELTEKLDQLISFPYTIINQEWGFRPTTPDRRPLLGPHPEIEQLIVFNGLGTKGVSLAPYFSSILTLWMEKRLPINNEVALSRYYSLYWKSA
jgi:glycine/D-amino acid oxidase-like deaminating enzyme